MRFTFAMAAVCGLATGVAGATVPFIETFTAGPESWRDSGGVTDATWSPGGGPDGSAFVSTATNVNAAVFGALTVLRGHGSFGSSGGAFVGDWLADGVTQFSFSVRHNAPQPLSFGARFASPANFPGALAINFAPVAPGVWTTITIPISPANPQFVSFEGSDFATVFSSIGNIQLLLTVPEALAGSGAVIIVDADNIGIVPGPAPAALAGVFLAAVLRRRR